MRAGRQLLHLAVLALLAVLTTGGACVREIRVPVPGPVEYRDRLVVQPIAPELLREHPIATGSVAVCPQVAAQRREQIEACNSDKAAIRAQQPPEPRP